MSKFDELIIKACTLVVAEEAENFDKDVKEARRLSIEEMFEGYTGDYVSSEFDWEPTEFKVHRNAAGKIVIEDIAVLDLYEQEGVEIDRATGTPLMPGRRRECYGNGEHEGFTRCCDACDHYLACFPECQGGE